MHSLGVVNNRKKYCILIIDDSQTQFMKMACILSPKYEVIHAKSGEEGLVAAHNNDIDLILLDLVMPGITGFEVLTLLKKSNKMKDVPVILITSSNSNEDEENGLALGAVDYIRKPFTDVVVKLRIEIHLQLTEQKKAINRFTFNEKAATGLNRILLDAPRMIIELWDEDFNLIDCNKQALEFFYLSSIEEYISRYNDYSPKFQPCGTSSNELRSYYVKKVMQEGIVRYEWMHQLLDGTPLPVEIIFARVEHGSKFMYVEYTHDLRPIKAALLKEKNIAELNKLLLETLPLPYLLFDAKFKVVDCNPSTMTLFLIGQNIEPHQYPKIVQDEWISMCDFDFDNCKKMWSDDCCTRKCFMKNYRLIFSDYAQNQEAVETFIAHHCILAIDAAAEDRVYEFEYELVTFYQKPVPCKITITPVPIYEEMSYALYIRDLREEKQKEAAKKESIAKTRFLAHMSHEMRTPMNTILGITETQLQKKGHLAETEEAFLHILSASQMLLQVINDILDMSKVEAGKMNFIPSAYDIASLIVDSVQLNLMYKHNKSVDFKLYADENLPAFLIGDELRIKQIINNLLSNAFKYTQKGSVSLFLSFERISSHDLMLIIEVSDTGQGLTQKQITRMFSEDYTRFNEQTNYNIEGVGLGSSIIFQLIQMMGGDMTVDSELGKGSTFIVQLPQKTDDSSRILGKETANNLKRLDFSQRAFRRTSRLVYKPMPHGKVLVVDDMDSNLHVINEMLSPYKINVETAKSGLEAVSLIEDGKVYDIIFMDHMMPKMDGIETARRIMSMGYTHPIVALTANALKGVQRLFFDNGFSGFISKPIDLMALDNYLNKFIGSKQPQHLAEQHQTIAGFSDGAKTEIRTKRLNESFVYDARIAIDSIEPLMEQQQWSDDAFNTFIIQTHGIKSALANIGQLPFSELARVLEQAGKDRDVSIIKALAPGFLDELKELAASISPKGFNGLTDDDPEDLPLQLLEIGEACKLYDVKRAEGILEALNSRACSEETSKLLKEISMRLLRGDFFKAIELAEQASRKLTLQDLEMP